MPECNFRSRQVPIPQSHFAFVKESFSIGVCFCGESSECWKSAGREHQAGKQNREERTEPLALGRGIYHSWVDSGVHLLFRCMAPEKLPQESRCTWHNQQIARTWALTERQFFTLITATIVLRQAFFLLTLAALLKQH
jgi:hypothetical protein